MRCVQREAGAPRLARTPSTGSPSKAEARSAGQACFRRRLLALLLAVPGLFTAAPGLVVAPTALLLGALGLFAAAPAQAQVWSATLTVDQDDTYFGCSTGIASQSDCSSSTVLTEDEFTYGGASYTIDTLNWNPITNRLFLNINANSLSGQATKIALGSLTLTVDAAALAVSDATASGFSIRWSYDPGTAGDWTDGHTVSLSLTALAAPTALTVTPSNAQLDLSWTAPSGSPTGYDVHYTSASKTGNSAVTDGAAASGSDPATAWVAINHSSTAAWEVLPSLNNGTTYRVRVRAKTSSDIGAWVFGTGTPAQPPDAPTNLVVTPSDAFLVLTWSAPSSTVTGYDVHYTSAASDSVANSATASGSDPAAAWVAVTRSGTMALEEIINLTNNKAYRVRVRAKNNNVNSAWVFGTGTPLVAVSWAATQTISEGLITSQSVLFTGLPAGASGSLTYAAGSNNPASLTDDLQTYSTALAASNGELEITLPLPVDDALNEEHETFTITINPGTGYLVGSPATRTVTITDNDPPAAPTELSLAAGDRKLTASWTKPAGPVAGYQLRYKETTATDQAATTSNDPSTGWVTSTPSGTNTSAEITGLTNGTAYQVQVRATDGQAETGNGYGSWSDSQTGTPVSVPDAPTSLTVSPGNARLSLSWTAPAGTLTGYDVQYTSAASGSVANSATASGSDPATAWVAVTRSGTTASQTISSLVNGTTYRVRVRARNSSGNGAWVFRTGTPVAPAVSPITPTTTITPTPTTPTTGGGGNRPSDLRPRFGRVRVPDQSYIEGTEITPLELPEATGGNGRLRYVLTPSLPEGLSRRVRRLSGTPTTRQATRKYTWTAIDADGDAARITFTVTVAPDLRPSFGSVNVPAQAYIEGTAITPLVLPEARGGNGPLTYALTPALPNGLTLNDVTRRLSGNPISPQAATLYTWTATDADGDEATLTFTMTIAVDPHRERIRELARRVLAEMARRAMSGALDTIGARFGAVGGSGLSLAGQPVSLESVASVADGVGMAVWNNQSLALGELLGESAFSLRLAANEEAGDGVNSEGPLWSVWGRGDLASFAGGREEETHYDGWLRSGWLGIDARSGRWVAGMAVSHEQGQADYGATVAAAADDRPLQGRLETSLTALYPYGRWTLANGLELQGVVGVGWGEAHHTPADEQRETGPLSMRMASLGVRKSLPDVAGLALALRADAAVTRIETGDGPEVIHNLSADSWRLRTGLEASRRFAMEGEAFLEPFLEAAARQDGGDGLEGSGVELAGGLRYSAPNVAVELRGRWLAAHSEEGAEEQGISLTARYGPGADGQGLFFALSPRWGAATGGAQALWGEDLPVLSTASAGNSGAVDAQVGYGFVLPQGGALTPFAEVGLAGADSRRLRLGTRYAAAVTGLEMAVELAGERRESGDAAAEHALQLDVDLRF